MRVAVPPIVAAVAAHFVFEVVVVCVVVVGDAYVDVNVENLNAYVDARNVNLSLGIIKNDENLKGFFNSP